MRLATQRREYPQLSSLVFIKFGIILFLLKNACSILYFRTIEFVFQLVFDYLVDDFL